MKLFTQREVADTMGISEARVKRLRLQRKLSYIPGRPVLIDEADLSDYQDRAAKLRAEREAPKRSKSAPPERTPEQLEEDALRKVRQRAQIVWMRRQINLKRK